MFIYENSHWVRVVNFPKYPDGYIILSPAKLDPLMFGAAVVDPFLPDIHKPVILRVILIGNIYRDGEISDEETGAYIDVVLKP